MSIYLTEEKKKEIEDKITILQEELLRSESNNDSIRASIESYELKIYKEILSEAIVLPIKESWTKAFDIKAVMPEMYPNGVIIKK